MRASVSRSDPANGANEAERIAAFRGLAERQLDPSYRLANAILGNPAEAEDAVHDAFVTAWRKWDSLREPAKSEAWFRRIVVNTCRDRLRRRGRTRAADIATHGVSAVPDSWGAIDTHVVLEQALGRLSADDQLLIILRYDHDLKVDDIAQLMRIPTGTVKWRLNRAHKRLRSTLGRPEGSSP